MTLEQKTVYDTAISEGASPLFAKTIVAQTMHESANFSSNVYKKNNNPMGMKMPSVRKSPYILGPGTKPPGNEGATPYAKYASLKDAIRDLFNFYRYNKYNFDFSKDITVNDFSERLRQKSYFGNTLAAKQIYIAGLTNNLKKLGEGLGGVKKSGGAVMIGLLILISISYILLK